MVMSTFTKHARACPSAGCGVTLAGGLFRPPGAGWPGFDPCSIFSSFLSSFLGSIFGSLGGRGWGGGMMRGDWASGRLGVADIFMSEVTPVRNATRMRGVGFAVHVVTREGPGPGVFSPTWVRADPPPPNTTGRGVCAAEGRTR
jgi:hypothetical protein